MENFSSTVALSWREHESFHKAQQLYPFVTNILVPDIAFQLGPYHDQQHSPDNKTPSQRKQQVDFLFLLRRDHESTILSGMFPCWDQTDDDDDDDDDTESVTKGPRQQQQQQQQQQMKEPQNQNVTQVLQDAVSWAIQRVVAATNQSYSYRIVDWPDRMELFHSDNHFFSSTSIQLLGMGQVVICDRLHAAILAYLAGIRFVYVDQITGKITKSLRVAFDDFEDCGSLADQKTMIQNFRFAGANNLTEAITLGSRMLRQL